MGSPSLWSILVFKIPEFCRWNLWGYDSVLFDSGNIHTEGSKKTGFTFSIELRINWKILFLIHGLYDFILILPTFIQICFIISGQHWVETRVIPWHLRIIEENPGDQHYVMNDSDDCYLHISYWYKYRATYIILKQTLALEKYSLLTETFCVYLKSKKIHICFSSYFLHHFSRIPGNLA